MSFFFPEAKSERENERCLKMSWHWQSKQTDCSNYSHFEFAPVSEGSTE